LLRAALIGGPMYDPLYDAIPGFTRDTGIPVEIVVRLPHPELNAWVASNFAAGNPGVDVLSTHTKYAPSQAQWLQPLDEVIAPEHEADLLPRGAALARIDGVLLQIPRYIDVRLLHYRRDLVGEIAPDTWMELADVASAIATPELAGFLFPGRDSGLFGGFYELLVGAGGTLFHEDLSPAFESDAGVWAVRYLADLHSVRRVTSPLLTRWHYDEISAEFRAGRAAMVCDWPGSYHLYRNPDTCVHSDRVALSRLPAGPAGPRSAYAGCHSFAIPRGARHPSEAADLIRYLTSADAQLGEARRGAIPCRRSALTRVREEMSANPIEAERWELLAESQETMIIPPRFAGYPLCEDAIWHAVQQAMIGATPAEQALAQAAAAVRAIVVAGKHSAPDGTR
jgi:multiple sugar transport system substrate-binding protein